MEKRVRTCHPRESREQAIALHNTGLGYGRIAERMELPLNTVKSWVRRYGRGLNEVYEATNAEEASREQINRTCERDEGDGRIDVMKDVMKENGGRNCPYCGGIVEQVQGQKPRRFCSKRCCVKWWSLHRDELNHYDPHEIECAGCGETFVVTRSNLGRKYCCKEHYVAAKNGLKIFPKRKEESACQITDAEMEKKAQERRADALALHSAGFGAKRIAQRMEVPFDTVKSWIHRYGQNRGWSSSEEIITAQISETVEYIPLVEMGEHRVFLVCGPYDFRGKIDGFLTKIPEMLAHHLTVGDVFVFCRRSRHQISALQWQGEGFAMMFKRAEGERYPWPVSAQVKVIEISRSDLQTLLEYPRFVRRLSGQTTPDNYL